MTMVAYRYVRFTFALVTVVGLIVYAIIYQHGATKAVYQHTKLEQDIFAQDHLSLIGELQNSNGLTTAKQIPTTVKKASSPLKVHENYLSYPNITGLSINCRTCAFVTGSGHLLGSGIGKEIDSNDCVFRSNDAPVVGFESDVGKRTTIRTVDKRSLRILTNKNVNKNFVISENEIILFVSIYSVEGSLQNASKFIQNASFFHISSKKFKEIKSLFEKIVLNSSKQGAGTWISNGFRTLMIGKDLCEELHVYGITPVEHCSKNPYSKIPYHYYEENFTNECDFFGAQENRTNDHHLFYKEKKAFAKLQKDWDKLYFHVPEWESNLI